MEDSGWNVCTHAHLLGQVTDLGWGASLNDDGSEEVRTASAGASHHFHLSGGAILGGTWPVRKEHLPYTVGGS